MAKKGGVNLNSDVVREGMAAAGLSAWKISKETGLDLRSVQDAVEGKFVRETTALPILSLLGLKYEDSVQKSSQEDRANAEKAASKGINEWEPVQVLSKWETTANGLQYKIWRMGHKHLEERSARGKQYDLTIPSTKEQNRLRTVLRRHPDVCGRFRGHPHIAMNLTAVPTERQDMWWVIDEWIPGPTLAEVLDRGRFDQARVPQMMLEIALGLEALHESDIIRRELAPRFVLLREPDGSVVLTDFELAKLLDGSPTVASKKWPKNPYRAPEVSGVDIDKTVDLYSWGRILVHALCGKEALRGDDCEALRKARLPKPVREVGLACVNKVCTNRPASIEEVIRAVGEWR